MSEIYADSSVPVRSCSTDAYSVGVAHRRPVNLDAGVLVVPFPFLSVCTADQDSLGPIQALLAMTFRFLISSLFPTRLLLSPVLNTWFRFCAY